MKKLYSTILIASICGAVYAQKATNPLSFFDHPIAHKSSVSDFKGIKPHFTDKTKTVIIEGLKDPYTAFKYTMFNEGLAFVLSPKLKKWGVIDTLGNMVINFKFDWTALGKTIETPYFENGVFPIWGHNFNLKGVVIVDRQGKVVKHFPDMYDYTNFVDGVAAAKIMVKDTKKSTQYHEVYKERIVYFNTKGELVYPEISADLERGLNFIKTPFRINEGMRIYFDYLKNRYGYVSGAGKIMIPAQYTAAQGFREGLAAVKNESGNWGFIDPAGKTVIDFRFSNEPTYFSEGYAVVRKREGNNPYCFIDKTGTVVMENLAGATWFFGGYSFIRTAGTSQKNGQNLMLSKDMKTTEPANWSGPFYDKSLIYKNGIMYNDYGVLARDLDTYLLYCYYGFQGPFRDGLAKCRVKPNGAGQCYINPEGEIVIIFEQPEF